MVRKRKKTLARAARRRAARKEDAAHAMKTGLSAAGPDKAATRASKATVGITTTHEIVQDSPLLALPPELRNNIYRFALINEDRVIAITDAWKPPTLLSVCAQIRFEAKGMYYASQRFAIGAAATDGIWEHEAMTAKLAKTYPGITIFGTVYQQPRRIVYKAERAGPSRRIYRNRPSTIIGPYGPPVMKIS